MTINHVLPKLTKHHRFYDHFKHIDIKYHFIHEKIDGKKNQFEVFTFTIHAEANILIKVVSKPKHQTYVVAHGLTSFNDLLTRAYFASIIKSFT
jgi:effector-binding domain-containing protein